MTDAHVVALCGSQRSGSYTRTGVRYALRGAERAGGTSELVDLRALDLPTFDPGAEDAGDAPALRETIRSADAVLLGTPMYHGSYSGVLKNALDYCGFEEFEGETVGLFAVAGGSFPITPLEHLRSVCRSLDAWVLPHQAAIPRARNAFVDDPDAPGDIGRSFEDDGLRDRVETLGRRLVTYADIEPDPTTFESEQNVGAGGR